MIFPLHRYPFAAAIVLGWAAGTAPAGEPPAKGAPSSGGSAAGKKDLEAPPAVDPAGRAETDGFLARWAETMKDLKTVEVRFVQEKHMRILRRPLVSRGTILLSVPDGRLRSTVIGAKGEVESELLAEKGQVRILYPALKRLEVYELGEGAAPPVAFPGLGGDVDAMKREYELLLRRDGADAWLTLVPRDPASPIREVMLVLRDLVPKELRQADKDGSSIRLQIEEFKKNAPIDPAAMKLDAPPGTEVIRPLGRKGGKEPGAAAPGPSR